MSLQGEIWANVKLKWALSLSLNRHFYMYRIL